MDQAGGHPGSYDTEMLLQNKKKKIVTHFLALTLKEESLMVSLNINLYPSLEASSRLSQNSYIYVCLKKLLDSLIFTCQTTFFTFQANLK